MLQITYSKNHGGKGIDTDLDREHGAIKQAHAHSDIGHHEQRRDVYTEPVELARLPRQPVRDAGEAERADRLHRQDGDEGRRVVRACGVPPVEVLAPYHRDLFWD